MDHDRDARNKESFERAKALAKESGGVVCGYTDENGTPHYFVASKDATEDEMRHRAFQARHGRPMNRAEELLDAAMNGEFINAYERAMEHYLTREPPEELNAFAD